MRNRHAWTPDSKSAALLEKIDDVIHDPEWRSNWPLTLRQLYYALVSGLVIENKLSEYKKLTALVAKGRLSDRIPWDAIDDHSSGREVMPASGYPNSESFIDFSKRDFLDGFRRHLSQSQPVALEVWVEKGALSRIVYDAARDYCVSTVVAKGYASVSYVNDLRNRIMNNLETPVPHPPNHPSMSTSTKKARAKQPSSAVFGDLGLGPPQRARGRPTKVLYFGDLDPSGVHMLPAMFETLYTEMGVKQHWASYERCALNPEQVKKYRLPQSPNALKDDEWQRLHGDPNKKKGDPRAETYKREFGKVAVELDALRPSWLQEIVRAAIERNFDMAAFRAEEEQEERDVEHIADLKKKLDKLLK